VPTPANPVTPTRTPPAPSNARISVGDGRLPDNDATYLLFQLPGDARLRAISFAGNSSGTVDLSVPANATWSQSMSLAFAIGTTVYTRAPATLGQLPWPAGQFTWSRSSQLACALNSANGRTGEPLRLQTARIGQPARTVASGFGAYADNATHAVLACDESTDRAIAATFGQGVQASRLWVLRLSDGAVLRSVDYTPTGVFFPGPPRRWVTASADASLIAESTAEPNGGPWTSIVRSADDGLQQAPSLNGLVVQGFSGDNGLVVAAVMYDAAAVVEWKTGRRVWTAAGTYGGYLAEASSKRLAVGIGFVGGSEQRDVYLVQADGSAYLLPAGVRVGLRY
jgi:hypothetical protein